MLLQPQDFRDVLVISREGTLKNAARVLAVDPATMGRRLDAIERRFGAKLFLRTLRGLEATPEAGPVLAAAEKLEAVQQTFEREQLARSSAPGQTLTVTAAEWGVPLLTPLLLEAARSLGPVQLRLRIENRALDLSRREADLALRVGRPTDPALAGKRIGSVEYGLFASRDYLRSHRAPTSSSELAGHPLLTLDATYARAPHMKWQQALTAGMKRVLETNSLLALMEAVRGGGGIATLPVALAMRDTGLQRVLPENASVQRDLWIVFHQDLRTSPTLRRLIDVLVTRLRPLFS